MTTTVEKRVDAKRPIILHISRKAFEDAKVGDPNGCAIAQECKRRFPNVSTFYIGATTAFFYRGNVRTRYLLNTAAQQAIQLFDENKGWPKGREVVLLPPPASESPASKRQRRRKAERAGYVDPRQAHKTAGILRKRTIRGARWLRGVTAEKRVL